MRTGLNYRHTACALMTCAAMTACLSTFCWARDRAKESASKPLPAPSVSAPSISLSPAVVMVKAKSGQTFSQQLTLWNNTQMELVFQLEARDVVVRDGKRAFVP